MFSKLINRQRLNALARREQSRVIPPDVQEWAFIIPETGLMIEFKSFVQLNYSVDYKVTSSPVSGGFVSYHKASSPETLNVKGAITGKPEELGQTLDLLINYCRSTDLLNVLTPERYFKDFNLHKLDYARQPGDGVDVIYFTARLQEIRQVENAYTNVKLGAKRRTGVKQAPEASGLWLGRESGNKWMDGFKDWLGGGK